MIQILDRAQPDLAVFLLGLGEQLAQQQVEHIEGVVLRAGLQAVNEGHPRGDTACLRQPGHGGHLDGSGKPRQRRDAARRHLGAGQLDARAAYGLDALQGQHERRGADARRPLAQPIQPGLAAALGRLEQIVQALSLRIRHTAPEQTPQARLHARAHLGDKALQHRDARPQHLVADQPAVGIVEQRAGTVGARPAQGAQPTAKPELHAAGGDSR